MTSSDGAGLIATERRRQMEHEGYTRGHDDQHDACELTMAAQAYIYSAVGQLNGICWPDVEANVPNSWPWADDEFKPNEDPIRNLVKAGALIAAEIDRLRGSGQCPRCHRIANSLRTCEHCGYPLLDGGTT